MSSIVGQLLNSLSLSNLYEQIKPVIWNFIEAWSNVFLKAIAISMETINQNLKKK